MMLLGHLMYTKEQLTR
uniref:Uncharacterized protein n=1 Tax=Arundo donax TaxID=35708 RepID=A0A0A8Y7S9_ARUDO